jgi:hypothetical protein
VAYRALRKQPADEPSHITELLSGDRSVEHSAARPNRYQGSWKTALRNRVRSIRQNRPGPILEILHSVARSLGRSGAPVCLKRNARSSSTGPVWSVYVPLSKGEADRIPAVRHEDDTARSPGCKPLNSMIFHLCMTYFVCSQMQPKFGCMPYVGEHRCRPPSAWYLVLESALDAMVLDNQLFCCVGRDCHETRQERSFARSVRRKRAVKLLRECRQISAY